MDRLLLDTHVFLWWRTSDPRIDPIRDAVLHAAVVYVSAASAWEASVKAGLGKLTLPEPFEKGVEDSGFDRLLVGFRHAEELLALPPLHRDPFDRMLIAQARVEGATLVSADAAIHAYEVPILKL